MIRDPLTGEWALLGTTRSERPNEYRDGPEERCAFCPGNEASTPPEIARTGTAGRWTSRAFPNKYPAIVPPDGEHEVIVDSPDHARELTPEGLAMWRARYRAALERMPSSYPVIFKNAGRLAGATLVHPHTQLIVLPSRPPRWEMPALDGTCTWCSERERAQAHGAVVAQTAGARAFVREASRFAWSLTILADECAASIDRAGDAAWRACGELGMQAIEGFKRAYAGADAFNLLLYSDPHADPGRFHWHMELVPRISTLAGFELSTGMYIRGATVKESAARWRRMIAPPDGSV